MKNYIHILFAEAVGALAAYFNVLQLVYNSLNQGQQKKLIKNTEVKKLFEFYGVIEEGEN